MRPAAFAGILGIAASGLFAAPTGDAKRGEQLFQTEQCFQCHSVKGHGGTLAPDLTRRIAATSRPP